MFRKDSLEKQINTHYRRLEILKQKKAQYGLNTPAEILIEIEDIEVAIQALEKELVEIRPGDFALSSNHVDKRLDLTSPSLAGEPVSEPPPPLDLEPPGGTMPSDSRFYIERVSDRECWQYIGQPKAVTLFIHAPRQLGKSSLMRRMIDRAEKEFNRPFAFIDFQEFPRSYLVQMSTKRFLFEFCSMVGHALQVEDALNEYWRGRRASITKCGLYLSEHIIPNVDRPFILAIDEVNRLIDSPFRDDFFGMLLSIDAISHSSCP